jgi:amino acid adenylation domain-containing protein
MRNDDNLGVAIIGMAGRFPGASNIQEFWNNLKNGIESIRHFEPSELDLRSGTGSADAPGYVRARGIVEGADQFDAAFFGIHPKEAELIDPQQRLFLECCWQAFEDAGYDPLSYPRSAAVFGGSSFNTYFVRQQCSSEFALEYTEGYQVSNYPVLLGTNPDFLATRVSYKLNLTGPSFTLASGCSTSLLAIWQACQNLLSFHCDLALAGGVSVTFPQRRGYSFQAGGMVSPDGHCRPFDEQAQGTVFGDGVGVVALKRLSEAIEEGDHIYAVIKGSGVNNDGGRKVGFAAPSVDAQAEAIALALADAGVDARSVSYVETHGTATPLGDPIELAALTQAFRAETQDVGFCAIGTAKSNVGHLDVAAGVTGVIKTALSLHHKILPPLLHFTNPNRAVHLGTSPFFVNSHLAAWERKGGPLRAGVSAFGVGGTNVHLVLQEAPQLRKFRHPQPNIHVLPVSAKSASALERACEGLANHIEGSLELDLHDVAFTLQEGRHAFEHRRAVVCRGAKEAIEGLRGPTHRSTLSGIAKESKTPVAFLFPGQGSQYVRMGEGLYRTNSGFRDRIDTCAEILKPHLGLDLRRILFPPAGEERAAAAILDETGTAQPSLFVLEYALAKLWMSWGLQPSALVGHSLGEFAAACIAGVFALEDALRLVAARAHLMLQLPKGAMLAVQLSASDVEPWLREGLHLAAINAPSVSVISGPEERVADMERRLAELKVPARRLNTTCASHSSMMEPAVAPFRKLVEAVKRSEPSIPIVSTVTGDWITPGQATDAGYWARHMVERVLFHTAVERFVEKPPLAFIEMGPGEALAQLMRRRPSPRGRAATLVVSLLRKPTAGRPGSDTSEVVDIYKAVGQLWAIGADLDWSKISPGSTNRRVPLPTYPFERKKFWLETRHADSPGPPDLSHHRADEPSPEEPLVNQSPTVASHLRQDRIESSLSVILEELSGTPAAQLDRTSTFLELGFDSLFLTQVSLVLQQKFQQTIGFRQLLEEQCTVASLAEYLDARLPGDARLPADAPPSALDAAAVSVPSLPARPIAEAAPSAGSIDWLVKQQLETMAGVMAKQLELVRSMSAGTPPAAASVPHVPSEQEFKPFGPYKPVQKGPSGNLQPQQREHLDALVRRYTSRTAESKRLTQQYRRALADPRVVAGFRSQWKEIVYPIVTVRSKGSRLWDVDGNEYVDILNGFGPTMFGHAPDFVVEAVAKQLAEGFEIGPQSVLAGKVAELICEFTGMDRATFCNTGSEAVMAALRVARTVTGRKRIVLFTGAYHGTFDEVLVKQIKRAGQLCSAPIAPGITAGKTEDVTVLDYGTPESLEWIRAHAEELAAVLVEPVQSRHPALQPVEFLRELRRITAVSDTALIFDEVVTGFRSHPGGVQALFGIRADLATYGKVLAGGLPIGVLAGVSRFMDALDGGAWNYNDDSYPTTGVTFFAGTFVRHPLALAAAFSVLNHLRASGPALQEKLNCKTAAMVSHLNAFLELRQAPVRIETFCSIFYFAFPPSQPFGSLFYYHLREKGVHVLEGFPCFLTTAHTDADIEHVTRAFEETVVEMQRDGMLAGIMETSPPDRASGYVNGNPPLPVGLLAATVIEAPLTEPQLEVLLAAQMGPEASCSFNESFSLSLRGPLNESALRDSLQEVFQRHHALRTTFDFSERRQYFHPAERLGLPLVDLSGLDAPVQSRRLEFMIAKDAAEAFELTNGPVLRCSLVRLAPAHHILRFTSHHAVCDGWSTNVIVSELGELYSAKCLGNPSQLPQPFEFAEYARNQADFTRTSSYSEIEAYWLGQHKDLAPVLDLPLDRPRGQNKSYRGATCRAFVDRDTYRAFKTVAAQHKCTVFAALLGAFECLLSRLTGQDDIVIGVPAAGQAQTGETLVGHCVNFLPLRLRINAEVSAPDALKTVQRALLDGYEHQTYTYGTLIRKLNIPRDPSRLPLVEVQFNLEKLGGGVTFQDLRIEVDPSPKCFVNFDLFLNAIESAAGLTLDCDYNSDLFDAATISRWLDYYANLLKSLVNDVNQPWGQVDFLPREERERSLEKWNDTRVSFGQNQCVQEPIDEQAAQHPDKPAVVFEGETLTYRELFQKSNELAGLLLSLGVRRGSLVAVCLERCLDMPVALLGILKAGAAYVPIDPALPSDRRLSILNDVQPSVILTHKRLPANAVPAETRVLYLDEEWDSSFSGLLASAVSAPGPQDLAYVIYTSGSTGSPKGVGVSHESLVNLLQSMKRHPGFDETDTLLAVTTLAFDIAGLEIFLPLVAGGKLVIASSDTLSDGRKLLSQIGAAGVTVMQATPATWHLLLDAGLAECANLKILCGGEYLPRDLANRLLETGAAVWNMYGPTESTIWSSTARVRPGSSPISIGSPIANTRFYVLDQRRRLAPLGVPGELYIAGKGVARGYRNQPGLTASSFLSDPFDSLPDSRMYKTGDLVRRTPDGGLEFLGRLDHQVKLRGFRIELGEIEAALALHPVVSRALVLLREDKPNEKRLVAYWVSNGEGHAGSDELARFLSGKLPSYMVPSAFVALSSLPQTPGGKIDRRALPLPSAGPAAELENQNGSARPFVAPRNEHEKILAEIWCAVLNVSRVSVDDNLFRLGADSLQVIQIAARADRSGLKVTPAMLLQHRNIAALAAVLAEAEPTPQRETIKAVSRDLYRVKKRSI